MDVWRDAEPLRRDARVGIEQVTWCLLWQLAGGVRQRLAVTAKTLAAGFQRDGSTLRTHLEKLHALGLVDLKARDRQRGTFVLEVLPATALLCGPRPPAGGDPQRRLPLEWSAGVPDLDRWIAAQGLATYAAALSSAAGVEITDEQFLGSESAPETARPPANQAGAEPFASGRMASANERDPQGATAGRGNFPVRSESSRQVGKFPRELSRGNFPTGEDHGDEAAISAEISRSGRPAAGVGNFPAGTFPRLINDNESASASCNGEMKVNDNENGNETMGNQSSAKRMARGAALDGPRAATAGAYLAALERCAAPPAAAARKAQLVAELRALVCDRDTHRWLYGFAADLLLVQGARDDVLFSRVAALLDDMRGVREREAREGRRPEPFGHWLNKALHQICADRGIVTPRDRKARRTQK